MENDINVRSTPEWVDECLASLTPQHQGGTDAARSLARLHERHSRAQRRRRVRIWAGVSVAGAAFALMALPFTRGVAQRLWDSVFMTRFDVIRLKHNPPPEPPRKLPEQEEVADLAEAAARVGFVPRFPAPSVVQGLPAPLFGVIDFGTEEAPIRVGELRAILQQAGVSLAEAARLVPSDWDRVVIRFVSKPMMIVGYGYGDRLGDFSLLQSRPMETIMPAGFPLNRFQELIYRLFGLSAAQARDRLNEFDGNPTGILLIPAQLKADIREVQLRSGKGTLIQNLGDNKVFCRFCPDPGELILMWNSPDRLYEIKGLLSQDRAIEIANSIN